MIDINHKVRILIIAGQLVVGGAERQLYLWLSNIDRGKYEPMVITLHPGDYWEKPIEALGITIRRVPQSRNRLSRIIRIMRIARELKPDLIHGWHKFAGIYAALTGKLLGVKTLVGIRNTFESFHENELDSRLLLKFIDAILTNSRQTASKLANIIKNDKPRLFCVQNAVEDDFSDRSTARKNLAQQYRLPLDAIWLVSMGRMYPLKRFDTLISITNDLRDSVNNFHLVLIGDGPQKSVLKAQVHELGLKDYVTFLGEVPLAYQWLKAFDIFCFTSVDEGLPNVIMEAAAAGLPIVTWQLPFYEELLVSNEMALLVEPNNEQAFAQAVLELILNPDLRTKMGNRAREHLLDNFSVERFTQSMTQVYEQLLIPERDGKA